MILPESRELEWMQDVARKNNFPDIILIEKTIRALSLLELLVLSGCPFVFKGGTALMLHLDSTKRLSIDIDIVCLPGTDIEQYLKQCSNQYGFGEVEIKERISNVNVPKAHAKFFYEVTYKTNLVTECILLDVLFEEIHYADIVKLPVKSRFLKTDENIIYVDIPSSADLLGDKLTAFAPNTTGIPYFKGKKDCSMEIIKQLFDIASLFDITTDLTIVTKTFTKFAKVELSYRELDPDNIQQVLNDIYQTSLCICLRGGQDKDVFNKLQAGISRIQNFIHSERYQLDSAIINASKAAYLSTLISKGITEVKHYNASDIELLRDVMLTTPPLIRLNKLKKTHTEAFFYWYEIEQTNPT